LRASYWLSTVVMFYNGSMLLLFHRNREVVFSKASLLNRDMM